MDTQQIHRYLQAVSKRYKSGNPKISIYRVANDFGIDVQELLPDLDKLRQLKIVAYQGRKNASVRLTEFGILHHWYS